MRGIAALWVVLFHASEGGHIEALYEGLPAAAARVLFDDGHLGVAIFFTLSGFVIAHSLSGTEMTARGWGSFMLRRSVRLDPAYWVSIGIVIAFGALSAKVLGEHFQLPSFGNLAAHVAYLQVMLGTPEISSVYWTLTYEIQFYAFFAAAIIWRHHMWALVPIAFLSAVGTFTDIFPGFFVDLWASFFIGVLAKRATDDHRWLSALAVIGAPLAWSGSFGLINLATAVILWISVRLGSAETMMNWRWLQFLGTISYSLYLLHNPISGATGFLGRKLVGSGVWADVAVLIMIVAASIIAAFCLWLAVERPTQRFAKTLSAMNDRRAARSAEVSLR